MEQSKLNANDLLLFAAIVEAGSFVRAAEKLQLPKATLSRRLNALENSLGERLLTRSTRKLQLTDFGQTILVHARQIAEEVEASSSLAQSRQANPSGRLRVSMPADLASQLLTPMLTQFVQQFPAVELQLDLSPRRVDLIAENYDLVLRAGQLHDEGALVARSIWRYTPALYASPGYLTRSGIPQTPADLAQHARLCLLTREQGAENWILQSKGNQETVSGSAALAINSPEMLTRLATAHLGIVASSRIFAMPYEERGELVRVLPDWHLPVVTIWAVYPERKLLPTKTRAFLDLLEGWLRPDS